MNGWIVCEPVPPSTGT